MDEFELIMLITSLLFGFGLLAALGNIELFNSSVFTKNEFVNLEQ